MSAKGVVQQASGSSLIPNVLRSSLIWSPGPGPAFHGFERFSKEILSKPYTVQPTQIEILKGNPL